MTLKGVIGGAQFGSFSGGSPYARSYRLTNTDHISRGNPRREDRVCNGSDTPPSQAPASPILWLHLQVMLDLGLGLRPMTTGLGLEGCGLGLEPWP